MKNLTETMAPWSFYDETHHDFHWHRYDPDHENWMSIFADREEWGEWTIEMYPDPKQNGGKVRKLSFESPEEAASRVAELMEQYNE